MIEKSEIKGSCRNYMIRPNIHMALGHGLTGKSKDSSDIRHQILLLIRNILNAYPISEYENT